MARFIVAFGHTTSPSYGQAVTLATAAEQYEQRGREHVATFGPTTIPALLELWGLVRSWKSSRLLIDDEPILTREQFALGPILECASKAATFAPPSRYCVAGLQLDPARWAETPVIACRYFMERYRWHLSILDWSVTPLDTVLVLLTRYSLTRCPFLDTRGIGPALERWQRRDDATSRMVDDLLRGLDDEPPPGTTDD